MCSKLVMLLWAVVLVTLVPSYECGEWSYADKDNWADEFKDCGGKKQSPIDIPAKKAEEKSFLPFMFSSDYFSSLEGCLFNNGHTLEFKSNEDAKVDDSIPNVAGGPLDETYQFLQFHLHWGSEDKKGSEHMVDGKRYPGEIHFVHWNTKYSNLKTALTKDDGLAVLGFFLDIDDKEAPKEGLMAEIEEKAAEKLAESGKETNFKSKLSELLFEGVNIQSYTTYSGSLTTPGCNEIVTWINFLQPLVVREGFMKTIRKMESSHLQSNGKPEDLVDNYRDPQDLNGRKVFLNVPQE